MRLRAFSKSQKRRGIAAVEMALLAPILVAILVGILELSRSMQVKQILSDACRTAGRKALQGTPTVDQVAASARSVLTGNDIDASKTTVTVTVNGVATTNIGSIVSGDFVGVTVTIPANIVGYVTPIYLSKDALLSETLVFRK